MLTRLEPGSNQKIDPCRRNINILLFNQAGETMQCWTLIGAIPVGWQTASLQADAETVAIEELTLAYEGIKVAVNLDPVRSGNTGGSIFHRDGRDFNSGGFFPRRMVDSNFKEEDALGIQYPLLSPAPLGQGWLQPQFLSPLGAVSLLGIYRISGLQSEPELTSSTPNPSGMDADS
ncbi:phage tail protein [Phormidesmis priestleyi]